jgi:hypothetical protein
MTEYLVFINSQNINYKGEYCYEFIFSDRLEIEFGDNWDVQPSNCTEVTPPSEDFITTVFDVRTKTIEFTTASKSDYFCMLDAVEEIVALAYETNQPENDLDKRLVFRFGEDKASVESKLKKRKIKHIVNVIDNE